MSLFSKKPHLAIDIHDTDIRIVQLGSDRKLEYVQSIPLPENVFKKEKIVDPKIIAETLATALQAIPKSTGVACNIPNAQCFVHVVTVPAGLQDTELKNAIIAEVSKIVPVNQNDVYWDYLVEDTPTAPETKRVVYVGVLRSVVDAYHQVMTQAGLTLSVLDCEGISLARCLVQSVPSENATATMIVTVGDDVATITIFDQKKYVLASSTVPFPAGYFTKSIVKSLRVSSVETSGTVPPLQLESTEGQSETVLQTALATVVQEIKKSMAFNNEKSQVPVGTIILAGDLAVIPGIEKYITPMVGVPVVIGDPTKSVTGTEKFTPPEPWLLFAGAFGLELRTGNGTGEINLFQNTPTEQTPPQPKPQPKPQTKSSTTKKIIGGMFGIIAVGIFGWVLYSYLLKPMLGI